MSSIVNITNITKFEFRKIIKGKIGFMIPITMVIILALFVGIVAGANNGIKFLDNGEFFGAVASYAFFAAIFIPSLMAIDCIFCDDLINISGIHAYTLPINRWKLLLGKFIAAIVVIIAISIVFTLLLMLTGRALFGWDGKMPISIMMVGQHGELNFYSNILLTMVVTIFGSLFALSFFVSLLLASKSSVMALFITFLLFVLLALIPIEMFFVSFDNSAGQIVVSVKPAFYVMRFFPFMHIDLSKHFAPIRVTGAVQPWFGFVINLAYTIICFALCFWLNNKKEVKG